MKSHSPLNISAVKGRIVQEEDFAWKGDGTAGSTATGCQGAGAWKFSKRRITMEKREEYRKRMEAQLKEWKTKIELLEAKGSEFTAATKTEFLKDMEELRKKKGVVKDKWTELQKMSGESWDSMKGGVEKASAELKSALDKVVSRFK
jgi:hypothetical protein